MNKLTSLIPFVLLLTLSKWITGFYVQKPTEQSTIKPFNFSCVGALVVSLDQYCKTTLEVQQVLHGNFGSCVSAEDFNVVVFDRNPNNGAIIDEPGTFRYAVFLHNPSTCTNFTTCEGQVTAEDKMPPRIEPPADTVLPLYCDGVRLFVNRPGSLAITGKAYSKDNCRPVTDTLSEFHDQILYDNQQDTLLIKRTFSAKDVFGNTSDTFQRITLVRPTVLAIQLDTTFKLDAGCEANSTFKLDDQGNIAPEITGFPFLVTTPGDTVFLTPAGVCGFSADYEDHRYSICTSAYRITRTWRIIDWFRKQERTFTQTIQIGDITPPTVAILPGNDTLRVSVAPFNCLAVLEIPAPQIADICSSAAWSAEIWQDSFSDQRTIENIFPATSPVLVAVSPYGARSRIISGLPLGGHRIIYRVRDACQNEATIMARIIVEDRISPIAITKNALSVSLNSSGTATLFVQNINAGSRDNCALTTLELRRKYTTDSLTCLPTSTDTYSAWGSITYFSCCDIGKTILVELRATDASGNTNTSWTNVRIEDKISPNCTAPPDTTIDCLYLPEGFNPKDSASLSRIFGTPKVGDNCTATFVELPAELELDACQTGTITRRFQAVDLDGNRSAVCIQRIAIISTPKYSIRFPKDFEDHCGSAKPDSLFTQEFGCNVLAVQVTDKRYESGGDECYKIYRTYEVINWCEYNGDAAPVIVPRDADCNGIPGDQDTWVLVQPDGKTYLDANADEQDNLPQAGIKKTFCDGKTNPSGYWASSATDTTLRSRGYWQYTQVIKIFDNIPPKIHTEKEVTICADQADCSAEIFLSVGVSEVCSQEITIETRVAETITDYYSASEIQWERYGRFPKYLVTGIVPVGEYVVEVKVTDGCQNTSLTYVRVKVVDCGAPLPVCYNGLSTQLSKVPDETDLDGDGFPDPASATVWVSDFVENALEDCSPPLRYSINRVGETPDSTSKALTLTCKDLGYLPVEIHAWDRAQNPRAVQPDGTVGGANHGFCTTYVYVGDALESCDTFPQGYPLQGAVYNPYGAPLAGVQLHLSGDGKAQTLSDSLGIYAFTGLLEGRSYTLAPQKTDDPRSGLTTLDLLMATQHILGIRKLSNPYQLITADVNLSNSLTTQDVITLRRLILNAQEQFSHGRTWRFIDRSFQFPDPANPWKSSLPEVKELSKLDSAVLAADFIAIKLGDINGSSPVFGPRGFFQNRSNPPVSTIHLETPKQTITAGQQLSIPFYLNGDTPVAGVQFAMELHTQALELVDIQYGLAGAEHINWISDPQGDLLLLSWNGSIPNATMPNAVPLFTLNVRGVQAGPVADALRIAQRPLTPEAYSASESESFAIHPLKLVYTKSTEEEHPVDNTLSIMPNPATEHISVQWKVPVEGEVTLSVRDSWGHVICQTRQYCLPGDHTWIAKDPRMIPGIYLVTLHTADGKHTSKKVLFLRP